MSVSATTRRGYVHMSCAYRICRSWTIQQRASLKRLFWAAYEAQCRGAACLRSGSSSSFSAPTITRASTLKAMPAFMVGHAAEAIDDRGGFPAGSTSRPTSRAIVPSTPHTRGIRRRGLVRDDRRPRFQQRPAPRCSARSTRGQSFRCSSTHSPIHDRSFRRCRRFGDSVGRFAAKSRQARCVPGLRRPVPRDRRNLPRKCTKSAMRSCGSS